MTKKKNIVIVAPNLSGKGGTETVLSKVLNFRDFGSKINMKIFLSDGTKSDEWLSKLNINQENIIINNKKGIGKAFEKIKFFIFSNDDVILALGPKTVLLAWLVRLCLFKKYKIVSWIHFSLCNSNVKNVQLLKLADYHLAISTGIVDQLQKMSVNEKRIYIVFNPVEKSLDVIPASKDNVGRIVYIGRLMLEGEKNLKFLIQALSRLPKTNNYIVDFFGDGEDKEKLIKYCADNLSENISVTWHGWVEHPWEKITNADILVLTSQHEGFGMVLAESISRGMPVVSTNAPVGPKDIVVNGKNGFLVELGNLNEFAKQMDFAISYFKSSDREEIKDSIDFLYDDSFYSRIKKAFEDILRN